MAGLMIFASRFPTDALDESPATRVAGTGRLICCYRRRSIFTATHFQRAMAGLTESRGPDPRDSFWTWRKLMYRFLDQLTPEQAQAIAELVFMEMLESGYGAVAEFHYLHHDNGGVPYHNLPEMAERIVAAARQTGMGLTLLPVLYMQGGCDGSALQGGQKRFGCDWDLFGRLHDESSKAVSKGPDDHSIGIAPHSLRAVSPDALSRIREICPMVPFICTLPNR